MTLLMHANGVPAGCKHFENIQIPPEVVTNLESNYFRRYLDIVEGLVCGLNEPRLHHEGRTRDTSCARFSTEHPPPLYNTCTNACDSECSLKKKKTRFRSCASCISPPADRVYVYMGA